MSSKNEEKIVMSLIILLIAFGIGTGIGISVGFAHEDNSTSHDEAQIDQVNNSHNISKKNKIDISNSNNKSNTNKTENNSTIYYSLEDLNKTDITKIKI